MCKSLNILVSCFTVGDQVQFKLNYGRSDINNILKDCLILDSVQEQASYLCANITFPITADVGIFYSQQTVMAVEAEDIIDLCLTDKHKVFRVF